MDQVRTVGLDIAKTRKRRAETMRIGCRLLYDARTKDHRVRS